VKAARIARGAAHTLVLLAGLTASPVAAQRSAADSIEVVSLDFDGVRTFDEDLLRTAIVTQPTRCRAFAPLCWLGVGEDRQYLDERALGADVVRIRLFYYQQGYREAQVEVDTARIDTGVRITFRVDEGVPVLVDAIELAGADSVPPDVLRELPLEAGAPLSLVAVEATRDTIRARLANRGFAHGEALIGYGVRTETPHAAAVHLELIPGPRAEFGEIEVAGAQRVSPAVIERMLTFDRGDAYSQSALLRSQRNLFSQELFRHAEIRILPVEPDDSVIPVLVQVSEGDLHRVRTGLGLSTADYLHAEGRWVSRSFFGGARRLELRGRIANLLTRQLEPLGVFEPAEDIYGELSGLVAADFTQPWFFGALNTLNAGAYIERRSIPDVFVRTAAGGYAAFARSIAPGVSLSLGYRPELTRLDTREGDLIFCLGFVACGADDIDALRDLHSLSPITASFVRDRSNSLFAPSRGYVIRIEAEYANALTGSDFEYARLIADVTDYHTIGSGVVFAARLRPGWAAAQGGADALGVHPQKRFFAGGSNSVRGFAQYRLGPKLLTVIDPLVRLLPPLDSMGAGCTVEQVNDGSCDVSELASGMPDAFGVRPVGGAVMVEGNIELRFPVFRDRIRGAAFVDFGQVWQNADVVDLGDVTFSPGLGVRYFSAIGPIRVDVGYNGTGAERLTVVTREIGVRTPDGCGAITASMEHETTDLCNRSTLRPLGEVWWNPRASFFDRLQLHFSIGQAF
jgi:outer membrane protein assembly factor BamA